MNYYDCFIVILVGGLAILAMALGRRGGATRWEPRDGIFPITGWHNPPAEGYPQMAAVGFTVVFDARAAELDIIHQAGMKALVKLGITVNANVAKAWVEPVKDHPAVIGYNLCDEPNACMFECIAQVKRWASKIYPEALYFVNLFPCDAATGREGHLGTDSYEDYLQQYMQIFQPKVLSFDHYPLVGETGFKLRYYDNLEIIRATALKYDVPFWAFALVSPHWSYRDPTEAEIRFQIFSNLVYGAQGLFYYCYKQPPAYDSGVVDTEGNPTHHYPQVQRINAIVQAWGPTLLKLRSTAVYHVGELPQGTAPLPPDGLVRSVNPSEQLIVGLFDHIEGSRYIMLMNKDYTADRHFRIKFDSGINALEEISPHTGQLLPVIRLTDSGTDIDIIAGGARLFKIQD